MQRRDMLAAAAAASSAAFLARARKASGQGDKRRRAALVGCGWFGRVDLRHLMELGGAQIVALVDPDRKYLDETAAEVASVQKDRPDTFTDFRDVLKPGKIDLVLVGSPDHWHALHAIAAMKAGADLYLQKPICHTFLEGRAIVDTARKLGRVVQVGTQRRSTPHIAKAREFMKEGHLGHVGMVKAYCYYNMRGTDDPPDEAPPSHLDYDLWTGPAPMRPYNRLLHPKTWRKFNEYSNGILGDMGVHMLDLVRWFMDLRYPKRIHSTGGIFVQKTGKPNITDTQTVAFDYGDLTVSWEHRCYGPYDKQAAWGVDFIGDKGMLRVTLNYFDFQPTDAGKKVVHVEATREPDPTKVEGDHVRPAGRIHMKDLLDNIASRGRPVADVEEGFLSTALSVLGNLSQQIGRPIVWDAKKERAVADEDANRLLKRAYRKPWAYPTVG